MKPERKGELFIFSALFLWGFFPIITVLTYGTLPSLISLGYSTLISAVFFAIVMSVRKRWRELADPLLWKYCLGIALFIGVLYYGFFFFGLSKTTSGNASIISSAELLTSFIFFNIWKKEFFSTDHIIGALCMIAGTVIILVPNYSGVHAGDFLVLLSVCFPPIGNYFQQKARNIASSESIMFLRSLFSMPVIFLFAYLFGMHASSAAVYKSLGYLLASGIVLFGFSKILWIEAIHRISVTKANALSALGLLLTLVLAWIILHQAPTVWQISALVPLFIGTLFLTNNLSFKKKS